MGAGDEACGPRPATAGPFPTPPVCAEAANAHTQDQVTLTPSVAPCPSVPSSALAEDAAQVVSAETFVCMASTAFTAEALPLGGCMPPESIQELAFMATTAEVTGPGGLPNPDGYTRDAATDCGEAAAPEFQHEDSETVGGSSCSGS